MKQLKINFNEQSSEFDYTYSCVTIDDMGLSLESYMDIMEEASKKIFSLQNQIKRNIKIYYLLAPAISFVLFLLFSIIGALLSYYAQLYVGLGNNLVL
jgi:hypothetical protein